MKLIIVLISYVLPSLVKELGADGLAMERITLIYSDNNEHMVLNYQFSNMARKMGFDVETVEAKESGVLDTIQKSMKYRNVINLRATGLCNIDAYDAFLKSNLLCTTDIYIEEIERENVNNSCQPNTVTLVSDSILKYNYLFQRITSNNDFNDRVFVILCLPDYLAHSSIIAKLEKQFPDLTLDIKNNCDKDLVINSSVLAVITPSTYGIESEVPMIIYNAPYILPEDNAVLPNSYNLMTTWYPLKYALVSFLTDMYWYRVAVLSDDSEYSEIFLNDLIPLLDEKGITYTSQQCNKRNCDFLDAARTLQKSSTIITVLNMNTKNAMSFMRHINHTAAYEPPLRWIVRDWPFVSNTAFHKNIDMFSITLSPVFDGINKDDLKKTPQLSGIIKSLDVVEKTYKNALGDRKKFTRYLSNFKKFLGPSEVYAHITRKLKEEDFQFVAYMKVRNSKITDVHCIKLYDEKPKDLLSECITRSRNYFKPCNHTELLLLLSVVIMFNLVFLVIMVFYSKHRKHAYSRLF